MAFHDLGNGLETVPLRRTQELSIGGVVNQIPTSWLLIRGGLLGGENAQLLLSICRRCSARPGP
jgi:hypothetical protein